MSVAINNKLVTAVLKLAMVVLLVTVFYFGRVLLIPLVVAGLLAMLLDPVQEKLKAWGLGNGLSIAVAMLLLLVFFGGIFAAIGQQAASFADSWPETQRTLSTQLNQLRTDYGLEALIPRLPTGGASSEQIIEQLPVSSSSVVSFMTSTFGLLGDFLLMLIYVILLLAHKYRIRKFVLQLMPDDERGTTHRTLNESVIVVQRYLRGYLILIVILSVLYSIGFLVVGMDYAILIAILVAVMAIIPYLGNIIGGLFAIAIAFSSGAGVSGVYGVLITMSIAQMLESYILMPLIVGDEVSINPLTTILCVVGMSILWGPIGAVIAIPFFGIVRVICSHVPSLQPYAYLLGQDK